MAAVVQFGGYTSEDNEFNLATYSMRRIYGDRGKKMQEVRSLRLEGELLGASSDALITSANNLINAFKDNYKDLRFTVNGTLAHSLLNNSDCVSGVKVVETSFPIGDPAELATVRTFHVVLQATYDACDDDLVYWNDSLEIKGTGGPWWIVVNQMAGIQTLGGPSAYQLAASTAQEYYQRGRAVGYRGYPTEAGPVNPAGEFAHLRRITLGSAKQMGNGLRFYPISWSYQMARDVNVFGFGGFLPVSK